MNGKRTNNIMRHQQNHSVGDFENFFLNQAGYGSIPVYHGQSVQRGYGFGNILASAFRSALPLLKRGAAYLGRKLLSTGAKVATDVVSGIPVKTSFKSRAKTAGKDTLLSAAEEIKRMTGSGIKKKRVCRTNITPRKTKKRRATKSIPSPRDIFTT